jgi:hypothetical protein
VSEVHLGEAIGPEGDYVGPVGVLLEDVDGVLTVDLRATAADSPTNLTVPLDELLAALAFLRGDFQANVKGRTIR